MAGKVRRGFSKERLIKLLVCVGLVLVIIFRNRASCNYSHIASLVLIYILVDHIVKNIVWSFIYTVVIWTLLYIILKNYLNIDFNEGFENEDKKADIDEATKKRVSHLKDMIKKLEGGIALTKDDLTEKNDIKDYDFRKSKVSADEDAKTKDKSLDDLTPREAQKETFELINTVKQLKDTVNELAPVLKEGKTILSSLGALKI